LAEGHLQELKEAVLMFLKDEDAKVIMFGSRSRGDHAPASDVDIGIIPGKKFNKKNLILLREYIEELNIPCRVDIVDLSDVSERFKQTALKGAMVWKE